LGHERQAGTSDSVHANTEAGFRGGEVQTLALARHLALGGHAPLIVARDSSALRRRAEKEGVPVQTWKPRGEWDVFAALRLRRIVRRSKARLVHAHTAHALTLALLARPGLGGVRVVGSRRVSFPLRSPLSRWKYQAADALVAVSEEVRRQLVRDGVRAEKVRVIHSGVDLRRFEAMPARENSRRALGISPGVFAVGAVGALVPHKGHEVLFEALLRLSVKAPALTLILAGDGELKGLLERKAEGAGISAAFLGYVEDPAPVYAALDLLVLPSVSGEGSPGVIKEAAAAGVPVVATDVGGAREILRHEKEALLVPPGDAGALFGALSRILEERPLGPALATAARERVKAFSTEAMARAHLDLYRELGALDPP
jgi:glycosyltransferase involved in cell wall biosynthesis